MEGKNKNESINFTEQEINNFISYVESHTDKDIVVIDPDTINKYKDGETAEYRTHYSFNVDQKSDDELKNIEKKWASFKYYYLFDKSKTVINHDKESDEYSYLTKDEVIGQLKKVDKLKKQNIILDK